MEITLNKNNETTAVLKVILTEADYEETVNAKLKDHRKKASFKGFRPGKVPMSMIKKMYGNSVKIDEVQKKLSESVFGYIREEKLPVVGQPIPVAASFDSVDWEKQADFELEYDLGLASGVSSDIPNGIETKKYAVSVGDADLDERIDGLKKQFADIKEVESVEKGDYLSGKVSQLDGDFENEVKFFATDNLQEGVVADFSGKKVGDVVTFTPAEAYENVKSFKLNISIPDEKFEGYEGAYSFEITEIKRSTDSDLNPEFFNKVLNKEIETEEEFRKELQELISENFEKDAAFIYKQNLREEITAKLETEFSEDFIKKYLNLDKEEDAEKVKTSVENFIQSSRWYFFRDAIVDENNIEVAQEEIVERATQVMASQYGIQQVTPEIQEVLSKMVDNYLRENEGRNYYQVRESVLDEKAMDVVVEKIEITTSDVTSKEFEQVVEEYSAKMQPKQEEEPAEAEVAE